MRRHIGVQFAGCLNLCVRAAIVQSPETPADIPQTAAQLVGTQDLPLLVRRLPTPCLPLKQVVRCIIYYRAGEHNKLSEDLQSTVLTHFLGHLFLVFAALATCAFFIRSIIGQICVPLYMSWLHYNLPKDIVNKKYANSTRCDPKLPANSADFTPFPVDTVKAQLEEPNGFLLLEGPNETGKSTLLRLLSEQVANPIFIRVTGPPPPEASHDYALYYTACALSTSRLPVSMDLARSALLEVQARGKPVTLLFDIELGESKINVEQLGKHIKKFVTTDCLGSAIIALSDANDAEILQREPRMKTLSTNELSAPLAVKLLHSVNPKLSYITEDDVKHFRRTPSLLNALARDVSITSKVVLEERVASQLERLETTIKTEFCNCKDEKAMYELASRDKSFAMFEVEAHCGSDFRYIEDEVFIRHMVQDSNLLRPVRSCSFKAQCEQVREAFARCAANTKGKEQKEE